MNTAIEIIDEKLKQTFDCCRSFDNGYIFGLEEIREAILYLHGISIQWIPVTESLPEGDLTEYLVFTNYGTIEVSTFYDGNFIQPFSKVEYWMPLPLPPKHH